MLSFYRVINCTCGSKEWKRGSYQATPMFFLTGLPLQPEAILLWCSTAWWRNQLLVVGTGELCLSWFHSVPAIPFYSPSATPCPSLSIHPAVTSWFMFMASWPFQGNLRIVCNSLLFFTRHQLTDQLRSPMWSVFKCLLKFSSHCHRLSPSGSLLPV